MKIEAINSIAAGYKPITLIVVELLFCKTGTIKTTNRLIILVPFEEIIAG